jgi:hypothetical protein
MATFRIAALAVAAVLGTGMAAGTASAMPVSDLAPAAKQVAGGVQDVRWVCGPYRCWWAPGAYYRPYYGYYGFVGPRPYWGWRRWWW